MCVCLIGDGEEEGGAVFCIRCFLYNLVNVCAEVCMYICHASLGREGPVEQQYLDIYDGTRAVLFLKMAWRGSSCPYVYVYVFYSSYIYIHFFFSVEHFPDHGFSVLLFVLYGGSFVFAVISLFSSRFPSSPAVRPLFLFPFVFCSSLHETARDFRSLFLVLS